MQRPKWNVGREEMYREVIGVYWKHGLRLIELVVEIMSTHFQHKDIHKGTWMISERNTTNQMDQQ